MGTTMHAHIEVKKNGEWLHYGCPNVTRNYLVFACINGTRKEDFKEQPEIYDKIHPVTTIHELPYDMSEVTKFCLEIDNDRYKLKNFGVMNAEDIENLQHHIWEIKNPRDLDFDLEEDVFKTYIGGNSIAAHEGFDDVRIIFWFDN